MIRLAALLIVALQPFGIAVAHADSPIWTDYAVVSIDTVVAYFEYPATTNGDDWSFSSFGLWEKPIDDDLNHGNVYLITEPKSTNVEALRGFDGKKVMFVGKIRKVMTDYPFSLKYLHCLEILVLKAEIPEPKQKEEE